MRVVAVCPLYPPHSRVGAWLSTHECLRHLVSLGHDVEVVVQLGQGRPYEFEGVAVHVGAHHIERLVPTANVVISHLGDNGRTARLADTAGVPSVRMAHGGRVSPDDVESASLIVWNSETFRAGRPGIVVHPPVRPEQYRTTPGDMVTLVNLSDDKGVKTMWRAAERLPDVGFLGVKAGAGEQITPRASNVTVVGMQQDMRDVFTQTRILLMPSAFETWGRVGIEAMCSGIPVIAHPTPGLRESLGDAGIFAHRDDIDSWVGQILRLLNPSSWADASTAALARATELDPTHDLAQFASAIEQVAA